MEVDQKRENVCDKNICRMDIQTLEEMLQVEREERIRLELEKEKLIQEKGLLEERREQGRGRRLNIVRSAAV